MATTPTEAPSETLLEIVDRILDNRGFYRPAERTEPATHEPRLIPLTKRKLIAVAVLAMLQIADATTTIGVLHRGGVELNPLVHLLSLWGAKAVVFGAVCLLAWMTTRPRRLWVLCGLYGAIVAWNGTLILLHG